MLLTKQYTHISCLEVGESSKTAQTAKQKLSADHIKGDRERRAEFPSHHAQSHHMGPKSIVMIRDKISGP